MVTLESSSNVAVVAVRECASRCTPAPFLRPEDLSPASRAGTSVQIAHEQAVHAAVDHPARSEIVAVLGAARAEEWTALDAGRLDVLGNRLCRAESWTSPGVNGRKRTRNGSGLRTASLRLTLIGMAFMG